MQADSPSAGVAEEKALAVAVAEKAKEFVAMGGEIYQGHLPDGANEHQLMVVKE